MNNNKMQKTAEGKAAKAERRAANRLRTEVLARTMGPKAQLAAQAASLLPKGTFKAAGSGIGAGLGGFLGGPAGALMGGKAGTWLGKGLSTITGMGDYTVEDNSLISEGIAVEPDSVPTFVRNDHSVHIKHREYIGDLVIPADPTGFNNTFYSLSPSNETLFPWLANVANRYQEYRFKGAVIEFKSMYSDYSAAGPLGTVAIASNYNVLQPAYTDKITMENSEFAVSSKPSKSILHAIECKPGAGRSAFLNVRTAGVTPASIGDARLYDWCSVQVATTGLSGTAGQVMGELWISYDVELAKPIIGGEQMQVQKFDPLAGSIMPPFTSLTQSITTGIGSDSFTMTNSSSPFNPRLQASLNKFIFLRSGRYVFTVSSVGISPMTTPAFVLTKGTASALTTDYLIEQNSGGNVKNLTWYMITIGNQNVGNALTIVGGTTTNLWNLTIAAA